MELKKSTRGPGPAPHKSPILQRLSEKTKQEIARRITKLGYIGFLVREIEEY